MAVSMPMFAASLWRRARDSQQNTHLPRLKPLAGVFTVNVPGRLLKHGTAAMAKVADIAAVDPARVAEKTLPALVTVLGTSQVERAPPP